MDSSILDTGSQFDASKLSDTDKKELNQFIQAETQKAKIQESVHNLTDICWKKCITGKISGGKLSGSEESCTQNCVERYLDSNLAVLKHLEQMKGSGAM